MKLTAAMTRALAKFDSQSPCDQIDGIVCVGNEVSYSTACALVRRGLVEFTINHAVKVERTELQYPATPPPAFLFDLDGTLIDSIYQHVLAWRAALAALGIDLSVWRIHRRIGMSGGLFVTALLRETGCSLSAAEIEQLQHSHASEYGKRRDSVRPLPGAVDLLRVLTQRHVPWAIATSGYAATARAALGMLGLPADTPMVTRDMVRHAKPDPDLFLAAAAKLGVDPAQTMVVGDSVWDLLAARRWRPRSGVNESSCPGVTPLRRENLGS